MNKRRTQIALSRVLAPAALAALALSACSTSSSTTAAPAATSTATSATSSSPSPTGSASASASGSATPTDTPTESASPSDTAQPSETPSETPSESPSGEANGIQDRTAEEIRLAALAAAKAQNAVRVSGDNAGATGGKIDLTLVRDKGAFGEFQAGKYTLQIVATSKVVYIKADKGFWSSQGNSAAGELVGNKWVKASSTFPGFGSLAEFGDYDKALEQFLKPEGTITKGALKTVNGQPTIGLVSKKGGTLYIATTGDPLPVSIDSPTGGGSFTDWGKAVEVPIPTGSDVIDLAKLTGS